jgi:peptidoglycan-associated lipoprotein
MGRNGNIMRVMLGLVLGILLTIGCSGHSVRLGTNSESGGSQLSEVSPGADDMQTGEMASSTAPSGGSGERVDGNIAGNLSGKNQAGTGTSSKPGGASGEPGIRNSGTVGHGSATQESDGATPFPGTDYGQNYEGVGGSGPEHGGVTGFGHGSAQSLNPDPESWANAYLREKDSSRNFYGDPSGIGIPNVTINPDKWAEDYVKRYGGPPPEYVSPEMNIASADRLSVQRSRLDGRREYRRSPEQVLSVNDGKANTPSGSVNDIYFAFDSWMISSEEAEHLEASARWLQNNPEKTLTIEGHCDERGTQDYNFVLGKRRAEAAREYLVKLGVETHRINVVSYGKERPFCQSDSEDCFRENRRGHMLIHLN